MRRGLIFGLIVLAALLSGCGAPPAPATDSAAILIRLE